MKKLFNKWFFYGLGQEEYRKCVDILFPKNIMDLIYANITVFVLSIFFAAIAIATRMDFVKAGFHSITVFVSLFLIILSIYKNRQYRNGKQISIKFTYVLILIFYANVMFIGLYLAVWYMPDKIAGMFIGIIICALFPYVISPVLYLCLTLAVMIFYIIAILLVKDQAVWSLDIQNAFFAVAISLIFGWRIVMHRMKDALSMSMLASENTIDELTKLKNRRDFMRTFQRFVSHYRPSDKYLCVALLDIDCFKNYNDHYGHLKGDECLRDIGKVLNDIQVNKGIYTARVGGEEFAMLWHIEKISDAKETGMYVNQIISELNIPHEKSIVAPHITVSIGIHIAQCGISYEIKDLYNLADKSLYNAKKNGRNCTVVSS
jgi:diguanylate cyclase (GGDEF)-like protein